MLRRNMTTAECQISVPKGRYLVFTLPSFQIPTMKTQDLNTKIITKKPKNVRNCESWVSAQSDQGCSCGVTGCDAVNLSLAVRYGRERVLTVRRQRHLAGWKVGAKHLIRGLYGCCFG